MTDEITVTHFRRLGGSPAELLAVEGMAATAKAGHLLGLHVSPGNEVVVAFSRRLPVALLVFEEYPGLGEIWVHFGYCCPSYRRRGYYRGCVTELRRLAAERGYARVFTAAHPNNAATIASIEARGGALHHLCYTFPTEAPPNL